MQNISAIASENYISFLVAMEGDGTLGCLLPRSNADTFIENSKRLINVNEHFPEVDFEVGCMKIETMGAGNSVMFQCTNTKNENKLQFAMESSVCKCLLEKIEGALKTANLMYGPAEISDMPWKFFDHVPSKISKSQEIL